MLILSPRERNLIQRQFINDVCLPVVAKQINTLKFWVVTFLKNLYLRHNKSTRWESLKSRYTEQFGIPFCSLAVAKSINFCKQDQYCILPNKIIITIKLSNNICILNSSHTFSSTPSLYYSWIHHVWITNLLVIIFTAI